ncbi:flagellin [Brenneria salicis]|uniref:Flagellin-like protein n=1 Tax=Brenneria salicis ATCC 15712 = DSM 30166 TaxID=714314 RepID=A0A366I553_9GAMM|nr:flagellin [Brenneria salicis]RBP62284.1 flagellin-like protein [Brenneria salicis ATCC 15712 = DSM 30166]
MEGTDADIVWRQNGITDAALADSLVLTEDNGFLPTANYSAENLAQGGESFNLNGSALVSYNGMTMTYSGDGDRYEDKSTRKFNDGINVMKFKERVHINETTEDLIVMVIGQGVFIGEATWDELPDSSQLPSSESVLPPVSTPAALMVSADYGEDAQAVTINPTPSDSESLGLKEVRLDLIEQVHEALASFDQALEKINGYRSEYGSQVNRFESIRSTLAQISLATSTARSRILDADYAQEVSAMTKQQILQQASSSVLVQANQVSKTVLALLQR